MRNEEMWDQLFANVKDAKCRKCRFFGKRDGRGWCGKLEEYRSRNGVCKKFRPCITTKGNK